MSPERGISSNLICPLRRDGQPGGMAWRITV